MVILPSYNGVTKTIWLKCLEKKGKCELHKISGARGVVVIVVGNEHGDTSSNPGRD